MSEENLKKTLIPFIESLKTYQWEESHKLAGVLNNVLKSDEYAKGKSAFIFAVRELLRSYYQANEAVFQARKRMLAVAHNLEGIMN